MDYKEINNIPMFFIVGRARSGTTLLQTLLDAHPSIIVPFESCIIMHLKSKYANCKNWNNNTIDHFLKDIFLERKLKQSWRLDVESIREQIYSIPPAERNYALLTKILYLNYPSVFEQSTIKLIGDKNPIYTLFIKDLIELFPNAKFLHIIRDYRANILSNKDAFSIKSIATLANAWGYHNNEVERMKQKDPKRFLMLKYEDLASSPMQEMQKICEFLQLSYDSKILDFHHTLNEVFDPKVNGDLLKIHGNLLNPVNNRKIDSWKKKLSKDDIELSEYIAGEFGEKYNYLPTSKKQFNFILFSKNIYGMIECRTIHSIIKLYYHSPLSIKKIIASITKKMYDWFKIKNYYNQTDNM
jgi:hypothetical protein